MRRLLAFATHVRPLCPISTPSHPPRAHARWICSRNRRRKNVGVPKNVQIGTPPPQLAAHQSPWEDYLIPELAGNSSPKNPRRYSPDADPFVVLGVESSCDDTAAAVVRSDGVVLGESRVSQDALTEAWGGVVPHVARDAHAAIIDKVIQQALADADMHHAQLDAVAATMGPGLEVCLRVGYRAARRIALQHEKDFVAVNHLEAHVLVARLASRIPFPFLTLLVSGGHCQLLLVRDVAQYEVLGGTLDDALGEAFDKTARLLGLEVGSGGGPALEKLALKGDPRAIPFPVPMSKRHDCNFSFAGLKTSVRVAMDKLGGDDVVRATEMIKADIAASFQETCVRHLEQRVKRAIKLCAEHGIGVNKLVVSGGVAANKVVRTRLQQLCESQEWGCLFPPIRLCTDNGVMVGWTGIERLQMGIADNTSNLDVRARWPLAGLGPLSVPLPPDVSRTAVPK
ncbi:Glycoprotease [Gracilaria domingensis]|nr:Glycoprotease [Gracilaria domingensis]